MEKLKTRPANRSPRPANRIKNWVEPVAVPERAIYCARMQQCANNTCQYKRPCDSQTLQPDRTNG